ncbi:MAG: Hint domain-containing protein [Sulfitobacter sp.]|nr:Hint domain-containing protein [Sulfitobacter sp.]
MKTGFRGTFVISWSQTEIDGLDAPPVKALSEGAAWSWRGDAVRVDGPNDVLRLDDADGAEQLRKRAARMVHRLVGTALEQEGVAMKRRPDDANPGMPLMDNSFVVTDGGRSYTVTLIEVGRGRQPLLMFLDDLPPRNSELWVVHHTLGSMGRRSHESGEGGVICFTPGTRVRTGNGSILIEDLREGDLVQTKDNGLQPIQWIGSRWMSGARLFAMPHLRPIRLKAGMFDAGMPDEDLIVSPEHRLVVKGPVAQELFNTDEVLVTARDLVRGEGVSVDLQMRQVTYIHLLFDQHQIMWANGVETESFHPASAALTSLDDDDRARLLSAHPDLAFDPHTYGAFARRNLSSSEAAILAHAA